MKQTILGAATLALLLAGPSTASAQSPCNGNYTARSGDTLVEIANRCGVTLPALLAANPGVKDNMDFEEGDAFRIPDPDGPQPSPQEACGAYYTIRSGDTLAEIAQKCGLTVPLLAAANGPLSSPVGLDAGRRIHIPDLPAGTAADPATIVVATRAAEAAVAAVVEDTADEVDVDADAADVEAEAEAEGDAEADARALEVPERDTGNNVVELVRVEGVLAEGERCQVIRDAGGTEYALVGEVGPEFATGEPIVVLGTPAETDACGTSPALELRIVYRPR